MGTPPDGLAAAHLPSAACGFMGIWGPWAKAKLAATSNLRNSFILQTFTEQLLYSRAEWLGVLTLVLGCGHTPFTLGEIVRPSG